MPLHFSGHSLRRTSATFLANSGADIETIMRHGGWLNESCVKACIEDSIGYKTRTGEMIQQAIVGIAGPASRAGKAIPATSSCIDVPSTSNPIEPPSVQSTLFFAPTIAKTVPQTVAHSVAPTLGENIAQATAETIGQTVAQTNAQTITPTVPIAETPAAASVSNDDDESCFDFLINDDELIQIVDRASQSHQQTEQMLVGNDDSKVSATSAMLTQSTNNSSLKAIMSRSFKSAKC